MKRSAWNHEGLVSYPPPTTSSTTTEESNKKEREINERHVLSERKGEREGREGKVG